MESKYYTPEIEELHVGFEYSCQEVRGGRIDYTIKDVGDLCGLISQKEKGNLRHVVVKYLDQEDIESLGWKFIKKKVDVLEFKKGDYKLLYDIDIEDKHKYILSISETISDKSYYSFISPIKNKSELKRLMKQLNIEV